MKGSARKSTSKPARASAESRAKTTGFTEDERQAMREHLEELKAQKRRAAAGETSGEADVLARIAAMSPPDRAMAERLHALIKATAPVLTPRTWYGMPAYAKGDNVVCFFQSAGKFKSRYATLGFSDKAKLDEGHMWPTAFALRELGDADEAAIVELLRRALG